MMPRPCRRRQRHFSASSSKIFQPTPGCQAVSRPVMGHIVSHITPDSVVHGLAARPEYGCAERICVAPSATAAG